MFCKKCGAKIDDDSKFCNKCGAKIVNDNEDTTALPTAEQSQEQPSNVETDNTSVSEVAEKPADDETQRNKKILIAGAVVVCVALLLFVFGSNKNNTTSNQTNQSATVQNRTEEAKQYNKLGNDAAEKKDYDTAITYYTQAIELDPNYAVAYNNRAVAYSKKKDYTKSFADYNRALEIEPTAARYVNRGVTYKNMNDITNAIADFKKALELDSNNERAQKELQSVTASSQVNSRPQTATQSGRYTRAQLHQIQKGMTYQQVVQIMGDGGKIIHEDDKFITYRWDNPYPGGYITVVFKYGRVNSKSSFDLQQ